MERIVTSAIVFDMINISDISNLVVFSPLKIAPFMKVSTCIEVELFFLYYIIKAVEMKLLTPPLPTLINTHTCSTK